MRHRKRGKQLRRTSEQKLALMRSLASSLIERQSERLQVADDLMDILDDAGDGLMLVEYAIDAESPNGRSTER